MAAPTFVQEAETSWTLGVAAKTTPSFNVNAGDILVAQAGTEDQPYSLTISNSGAALTWTQRQLIDVSGFSWTSVWTATVDTTRALTVTVTPQNFGASDRMFGLNVLTYRDSDGIGASSKTNATGAPSLGITTTQADSAVPVFNGDWNAVDGAVRTWRTVAGAFTEQTYAHDSARGTVYGGFHANVGAAGAKTVGLTDPAGQAYGIIAVEVKGPAGDTTPPVTTLGNQTRTTISRVPGWDAFDVTITTDEPFVEYELRRVPAAASTRTEGSQIETAVVASTSSLVVTVTDDELVNALASEGDNIVKAFTKDVAGNWSS